MSLRGAAICLWFVAMGFTHALPAQTPPASAPASCAAPEVKRNARLDVYARMLAGLPMDDVDPAVAAHARQLDRSFVRLEQVQLSRVRDWSAKVLPPEVHDAEVLFYPFSGPDVLYPAALFPRARKLLFTGLEPVGAPPAAEDFESPELADSLGELRRSLVTLLGQSFFVTAQMQAQFDQNRFRGVTPILMLLLARSGYAIESVTGVVLAADGKLCARALNERVDHAGVEIRYRRMEDTRARSLLYLRVDLSNEGLAAMPGYAAHVRQFGVQASYVKSASYLMHTAEFSAIRDLLLEVSPAVLQDDSGIPFRQFAPERWQATLHGQYAGAAKGFTGHTQADLRAAFAAAPASPLPFWIGYRHSPADSNLQLYRRVGR